MPIKLRAIGRDPLNLYFLAAMVLAIPSIVFLSTSGAENFKAYFSLFLVAPTSTVARAASTVGQLAFIAAFSACWFATLRRAARRPTSISPSTLFLFVAGIGAAFIPLLPYTSSDVFTYIGFGWQQSHYDVNPYLRPIASLPAVATDEMLQLGHWQERTAWYGPLWLKMIKWMAAASFGSPTVALLIHKIGCWAAHLATTKLLFSLTRHRFYVVLWGLNPLILFECIGNGHNDVYVALLITLGLVCLIRWKTLEAACGALAAATMIKYGTIVAMPLVLIAYARMSRNKPALRATRMLGGVVVFAIVVLVSWNFFGLDSAVFESSLRQQAFKAQSVTSVSMQALHWLLLKGFEIDALLAVDDTITFGRYGAFALACIAGVIALVRCRTSALPRVVVRWMFRTVFVLMALVSATFRTWYVVWLVPLLPGSGARMLRAVIVLSISAEVGMLPYFAAFGEPIEYEPIYFAITWIPVVTVLLAKRRRGQVYTLFGKKKGAREDGS